jgi:hypothetical protein
MLSAYPGAMAEAEARLTDPLGPVADRSGLFAHAFTEYYRDEMGHPLGRLFITMERLIRPEDLAGIKRLTNDLEDRIAARGEWPVARPVNLDPGYIAPAKLVLASTKNHSHRLYLADGIYGEVTLLYARGAWQTLPWTYPDYRTPEYHAFFARARERLVAQRREGRRD